MKMSRLLLAASMAFMVALPVSGAKAATVDYTGNFVNMSPVSVGQSGTITGGSTFGDIIMGLVTGSLPSNSMITFSYTTPGALTSGYLDTSAGYSYKDGGVNYTGYSHTDEPNGSDFSIGFENGSPSTALAVTSAQINNPSSVTVIIKNFSAGVVTYANAFMARVLGNPDFTIAYNVSAVPVPAALPLFGLGLGALAAMKSRSRRKKQALTAA